MPWTGSGPTSPRSAPPSGSGDRSFTWADGARRFETWCNYLNIVGLGAAVSQALDLGLDAISARARQLGAYLRDQLSAIDAVTVHDLGADRCAIVTAGIAGQQAADVAAALATEHINVGTTVAEHSQFDTEDRAVHPLVRLSPHYYNTHAELDRAAAAIDRIARAGR